MDDIKRLYEPAAGHGSQYNYPTLEQYVKGRACYMLEMKLTIESINEMFEKDESIIKSAWARKTKEQREKVLRFAWAHMMGPPHPGTNPPASQHHGDIPEHRSPNFRSLALPEAKRLASRFMWPYINLEDLTAGDNFLLLLDSRRRHQPVTFAEADRRRAIQALSCCRTNLKKLKGYDIALWKQMTDAKSLKMPAHSEMAQRIDPPVNLLMAESALRVLTFLHVCCDQLLEEGGKGVDASEKDMISSFATHITINKDAPNVHSILVPVEESYRPPFFNLARLRAIVKDYKATAAKHFFDLREDPGYFASVILDAAEHRASRVKHENGHRLGGAPNAVDWHTVGTAVTLNALTRIRTPEKILAYLQAIEDASFLENRDEGSEFPGQTDLSKPPHPRLQKAFQDLHFFLVVECSLRCDLLEFTIPTSPQLCEHFVRISDIGPLIKSRDIYRLKGSATNDEFLKLLGASILAKSWFNGSIFEYQAFYPEDTFSELMQRTERVPDDKARISLWCELLLINLALLYHVKYHHFQLAQQMVGINCEITTPEFTSKLSGYRKQESKDPWVRLARDFPEYAKHIDPSGLRFHYPSKRRITGPKTRQRQQAERNLDDFWRAFDQFYENKNGRSMRDELGAIGIEWREPKRTADWVPRNKEKKVQSKPTEEEINNFQVPGDRNAPEPVPSRFVTEPEKVKPKTRGTADISKAASKDNRAGAGDDGTTPPVPEDPNSSEDPSNGASEATPSVFTVNKRAYQVFTAMFAASTGQDAQAVGEIAWTDFMYAMTSIGFTAERRQGSSWHFMPSWLSTKKGISFHEPHPDNKIHYILARNLAHNLRERYGFSRDSFKLA
ncbi:hypothetical protein F4775DRAFT_229365 [Biscogniauxia sp. FL1348]|nr:hypothetical protein F4775DRAFT_229365 [Biscogniauxia sp. FL1348]